MKKTNGLCGSSVFVLFFFLFFFMILSFVACSGGQTTSQNPGAPGGSSDSGSPGDNTPPCTGASVQDHPLCQFVLIQQKRSDGRTLQYQYDVSGRKIREQGQDPGVQSYDEVWTYLAMGDYSVRNIFLEGNATPDEVRTHTILRDAQGRPIGEVETRELQDDFSGPMRKRITVYDYSIPNTATLERLGFETSGGITELISKEQIRENYDSSGALISRNDLFENVNGGLPTYQYLERTITRNDQGDPLVDSSHIYNCDMNPDCPGPGYSNVVGDPSLERRTHTYDSHGLSTFLVFEHYDFPSASWTTSGTCQFQHDLDGNESLRDCDGKRIESAWQRLYDHLGVEAPSG